MVKTEDKSIIPEDKITSRDVEIGAIAKEPGSARMYKTGDWRSRRPKVEQEKCTKCGLCYVYCPEGCIKQTPEGYFEPDLYYCKGCGVCAAECPKKAITMIEESE